MLCKSVSIVNVCSPHIKWSVQKHSVFLFVRETIANE